MKYLNFMPVWRKRAKLSQWELSQQLRISQKDISDIETGKALPPIEVREKICKIIGIEISKVFP